MEGVDLFGVLDLASRQGTEIRELRKKIAELESSNKGLRETTFSTRAILHLADVGKKHSEALRTLRKTTDEELAQMRLKAEVDRRNATDQIKAAELEAARRSIEARELRKENATLKDELDDASTKYLEGARKSREAREQAEALAIAAAALVRVAEARAVAAEEALAAAKGPTSV